jgi:hypothetical protein
MVNGTIYYSSPKDSVKRTLLQACSVEMAKEHRQDPVKDRKEEQLIERDLALEAKVEEQDCAKEEESLKE